MTTMKPPASDISSAELLLFLREKFPVIHNSNIFFRDLYYGVMAYMETRGRRLSHAAADGMAKEIAARLVSEGILTPIDHQSWRLNYPQFALPRQAPAPAPAAAKPAAAAPPPQTAASA
jgi:hypothetical protein